MGIVRHRSRTPAVAFAACMLLACTSVASTLSFCDLSPGSVDEKLFNRMKERVKPTRTIQWSPDGSQFLVPLGEFFLVQADGSAVEQVSRDTDYWNVDSSPEISPDGTRIVYTTSRHRISTPRTWDRNFQIESSTLDGSDRRRLTDSSSLDTSPAWSPDGKRIAFVRLEFGKEVPGIYTMAPDGSGERRLVAFNGEDIWALFHDWGPEWSPDGNTIAFMSASAMGSTLYVVEADGSGLSRLHRDSRVVPPGPDVKDGDIYLSSGGPLAWSPDGQMIAFMETSSRADGRSSSHTTQIYVIGRDGEGLRSIWESRRTAGDPPTLQWLPDGSKILLAYNRTAYLIDVHGSVSDTFATGAHASLSPDGSKVAALSGNAVIVSNSDGTETRFLAQTNAQGKLVTVRSLIRDRRVDLTPCSREPNFIESVLGSWMLIVPDPEKNRNLVRDCEALLTARDALAGDAELNWSGGVPITEWDGVTVDGGPLRVRVLNLTRNHLSGIIPPELGQLTALKEAHLRQNNLTGLIPPELANAGNLKTLDISYNHLSGPVPPGLANLPNLFVDLTGNHWIDCIPVGLNALYEDSLERCEPEAGATQ